MHFLNSVGAFLVHLTFSIALLACFVAIYMRTTPHDEPALIRNGNAAAAIGLGGAIIGYALVLGRAVTYSEGIVETLVWGVIALAVQVVGHVVLARLMPRLYVSIEAGDMAAGISTATVAIALGLVNAASMTP